MQVRERNEPINAIKEPSEVFEEGNQSLQSQLYSRIYQKIEMSRKLEKRSPIQAIEGYLEASYLAWKSKDELNLPLYNHAVGQVADLLMANEYHEPTFFRMDGKKVIVRNDASKPFTYSMKKMDDLIPVDCLEREGIRTEVKQYGVGAPMAAVHSLSGQKQSPFVAVYGGAYNVTAILDFSNRGEAILRMYDSDDLNTVPFWGEDKPLQSNLTASYYALSTLVNKAGGTSKIMGVFQPTKYSGRMGLHLDSEYDPEKIPLILVHGLVSNPYTWVDPMNELLVNEKIRHNYQIYTYYYPTGFPIRMTGTKLKEDLIELQKYARENGGAKSVDKMVVFGHSMGGMLTAINVRKLDQEAWSKISKDSIDDARMSPRIKRDMKMIFEVPQVDSIKRVVFIATPHQGSNMANSWYGSFVATMIRIPSEVARLDLAGATQSFTDLGKSLFNEEGPVNSMVNLRVGNSAVAFANEQPILPRVTYHSIIGDQGKGDTPNSSDGIVPYWSSHLEGAESELIVPSGHSAHHDPKAIEEMKRILLEHLDSYK